MGDIITELSRFGELFVIARNSSFQYKGKAVDVRKVRRELGVHYVLEGTVRRCGDRIRISAQLVDAATGIHRWAEHYNRKLEDVFAVQDEVTRSIVTTLATHVRKAETERTRAKPPNSWQAYDYYLQAEDAFTSFSSSFSVDDLYEVRRRLQLSLSVDANYARSYAHLALGHPRRAVDLLEAHMRLDPFYSPFASGQLGFAHYMLKQYALALPALRDCASRSPNLRSGHVWLAATYAQLGQLEEARAAADEVLRIQPDYTISGTSMRVLGFKFADDAEHFFDGLRQAGLPE